MIRLGLIRREDERRLETSPPSLPRLIATDLDGTLLSSGGLVSARTGRALSRARAAGTTVVMVVTGGPARHVRGIPGAEQLGGHVICLNGALRGPGYLLASQPERYGCFSRRNLAARSAICPGTSPATGFRPPVRLQIVRRLVGRQRLVERNH
jgi:hypothetical protein